MVLPVYRPIPVYYPDWYWFVGSDKTQVFSSARMRFVPVADATYGAWLSTGRVPLSADDMAALYGVLFTQGVTSVSASTLLGRLSVAEYTAIRQAAAAQLAQGSGQLEQWLDMARVADRGINLYDPVTTAAKAALVAAGLLTQSRADAVFAPE